MVIPPEGNGKNKKIKQKIEICHGILKWKNWKFSFLKFEIKVSFEIWKKNIGIWPEENEKKLKWRNHIFRLCHRDKTCNNTPILPIPPMHTTISHRCKLWWYTINLSHRILSYWSFLNSGIGWCETWVPLGPHRQGSQPSPTSGSSLLEDPPTCQWAQPT
jgi:hypothetical protein